MIDTHTQERTRIYLGESQDVAITPDGRRAYVWVIDF